jgi:hypothetical protein
VIIVRNVNGASLPVVTSSRYALPEEEGDWEPKLVPSWLCLRETVPSKAVVVSRRPKAFPASNEARLYETWIKGEKVYDPASEYCPGQVVPL